MLYLMYHEYVVYKKHVHVDIMLQVYHIKH